MMYPYTNHPDYPDYVAGPSVPTVPLQLWHDKPTMAVSPFLGLPKVTPMVVNLPGSIPGSSVQIVLGVTTGLLTR